MILALYNWHGLEMLFGSCISVFAIAVVRAGLMSFIRRWWLRSRPMLKLRF